MKSRGHPAFFLLFVLVVAPIGAAVVIAVLLLFGVPPHTVFAPGHAAKALLEARGVHAPNAVGVLTTVGLWWLGFLVLGVLWERRQRRAARS